MPLLTSFIFGFAPMFFFALILYWVDRYEKEPALLLGAVFLWGAVLAAGSAFLINTVFGAGFFIFTNSEGLTEFATGSLIAPFVEEILKGLAVLIVFLAIRREFDSILDGILYAGVAALGFAATENFYYIYTYGYQESGWTGLWGLVFIRVILVGWQHPFYTAFTGIGLAISRLSKRTWVKFLAPFAGLGLAMFTHSFHNTLATFLTGDSSLVIGTFFDWTGWFFMFCFIFWAVFREKKMLRTFLSEDVAAGTISRLQLTQVISIWQPILMRTSTLLSGNFRSTNRFFQVCGELAHKRSQLATFGNEDGNHKTILALQSELAQLSASVKG